MKGARRRLGAGAALLLLTACGGAEEGGARRSSPVATGDADGLEVAVTLDQLVCVEQNDAHPFRDEV